jgi:hypothetical protein
MADHLIRLRVYGDRVYLNSSPRGEGNLLLSLILFFAVAFPLKYLLIGLVSVLGAAVGFIAWIDGIVIAVMEVFLHVHHVYKAGAEVKEAASDLRKSGRAPTAAPVRDAASASNAGRPRTFSDGSAT